MNTKRILFLALALVALAAHADWRPDGAFVEAGLAPARSYSTTAGVFWAWDWQGRFGNAETTGFTEAWLSHWSAMAGTQRETVTQAGLLPIVRLRLDHGHSPWFMEGGIGLTMTDSLYRSHGKQFSTRFNFIDVFGVGRSLGAERRREVSLRLAHVSNANIKRPNPGENFVQLRYAVSF